MYQVPSPAFATGCNCPAGPHRTMPLIQRLLWRPLNLATCQACGATLVRRRAMLFFVPVPVLVFLFVLLVNVVWPDFADSFYRYNHVWIPLILLVQAVAAWLEYRFSPITVKVGRS